MYTEQQQRELSRAIYEYTADQLIWRILYLNSAVQNSPGLDVIGDKLLSLPRTFSLSLLNIDRTPAMHNFIQAAEEENRLYVGYADSVFQGKGNQAALRRDWEQNTQKIATLLSQINAFWEKEEWMTLISHQKQLLDLVMLDVKEGKCSTFTQILPMVKRMAMEMSDYLAHGLIQSAPSR